MKATERCINHLSRLALTPPGAYRWAVAIAVFGFAFALRSLFNDGLPGVPFATFLPAIVIINLICGGFPATAFLILSVISAWYFWLPPYYSFDMIWPQTPMSLLIFATVGGFEILLVEGFVQILAINTRQQETLNQLIHHQNTMFREMQHRVSNNMQFIVTMLSLGKRQIGKGTDPTEVLSDAINRITSMAQLHRRLHEIATYDRGFEPVLQDVLKELLAGLDVEVRLNIVPVAISLDQMTAAVLIVVEAVTNSIKYVFLPGRGALVEIQLRIVGNDRLALIIRDDGPGRPQNIETETTLQRPRLGLRIMDGLATQLQGRIRMKNHRGMVVRVDFPMTLEISEIGVPPKGTPESLTYLRPATLYWLDQS